MCFGVHSLRPHVLRYFELTIPSFKSQASGDDLMPCENVRAITEDYLQAVLKEQNNLKSPSLDNLLLNLRVNLVKTCSILWVTHQSISKAVSWSCTLLVLHLLQHNHLVLASRVNFTYDITCNLKGNRICSRKYHNPARYNILNILTWQYLKSKATYPMSSRNTREISTSPLWL